MNYLLDGRCEIFNNAAERRAKTYVMGRKNFLFHDTADGATVSVIVLSLIEIAKANNLNIYQYLYTLLLYMPDYKNEPAGIKQLLPWSVFIAYEISKRDKRGTFYMAASNVFIDFVIEDSKKLKYL